MLAPAVARRSPMTVRCSEEEQKSATSTAPAGQPAAQAALSMLGKLGAQAAQEAAQEQSE